MRILFSGYRDHRHSKYGGYDHIVKMSNSDYLNAESLPFGKIPVGKKGKKLNLFFLDFYTRLKKNQYDIIHFFYFDFMMFQKKPKRSRAKFIATVHMKSEYFSMKQIEILKSFDLIVCLSESEETKLRILGINAHFIPHGFNIPEFKTDNNFIKNNIDSTKINIFYSGTNYRDLDVFMKCVIFCNEKNLNYTFHAIGQKKDTKILLKAFSNVNVYNFIDDDKYFSLLSNCDYNFLPLTFATANNTLLEAQSIGIISILPKISGIDDYSDPESNLFFTSIEDMYNIFNHLAKKPPLNSIKVFSKQFKWDAIYIELVKLYGMLNY